MNWRDKGGCVVCKPDLKSGTLKYRKERKEWYEREGERDDGSGGTRRRSDELAVRSYSGVNL